MHTMIRAPFQSAIKSFAVCRIHAQRTIFRCFWALASMSESMAAQARSCMARTILPRCTPARFPPPTRSISARCDASRGACESESMQEQSVARWEMAASIYLELKKFYDKHGQSGVPRLFGEKQLANWVRTQRDFFKKGILSEYRVQKLSELDFCIYVKDTIWMEKYSYDTLLTGLATVSSFMVLYCRMGTAVVFSRSTTSVPLSSAICSVQR